MKRWEGFVVEEREGQDKPYWHRVATLFEAKNGDGFTLVVPPGVSVGGRVIFREPKERDAFRGQGAARPAPVASKPTAGYTPEPGEEDLPF